MVGLSTIQAIGLVALCAALLALLGRFKLLPAVLVAIGAVLPVVARDMPLVIFGIIAAIIGATIHLHDQKSPKNKRRSNGMQT